MVPALEVVLSEVVWEYVGRWSKEAVEPKVLSLRRCHW